MSARKIAVVTGGAGFIGSHMVDRLLDEGFRVHVIDNLVGGRLENLAHRQGDAEVAPLGPPLPRLTRAGLPILGSRRARPASCRAETGGSRPT